MPFKKGLMPMRRSFFYLERGKIQLRDQVRILSIGYSVKKPNHKGAADFVFWRWAQLQYKNPTVQLCKFRDLTPTPFIQAFLESGREVLIDLDGKSVDEIEEQLRKTLGKTDEMIDRDRVLEQKVANPAYFGETCDRHCICEVSGQHPCTGLLPSPSYLRTKWRLNEKID